MTTPEADPADVAEQHASAARDEARSSEAELPLEASAADFAEQQVTTAPGEHVAARDVPLEADASDAAEQAVVVEEDDEYR